MLEGATVNALSIEFGALASWLSVVTSMGTLVFVIITHRSGRNETRIAEVEGKVETKASKDHVASLAAKIDVAEDKITRMQSHIEHMPDKDTTHRLELAIGELRTEMRGISEKVKPISAMADRIQEVLLEKVAR